MHDKQSTSDQDVQDGLIALNAARASGASGVTPNRSWSQSNWVIDPSGVAGPRSLLDLADRWNTYSPTLNQLTTITTLDDLDSTDIWRFNPYFTESGALNVQGSFKQLATATVGVFTPPNYAAGTLGTITASGQPGAFWAPYVGKYVKDATANAYFYVVADLGSATASISQPMVPLSPGTYATIANGDALSIGSWTTITGSTLIYGGSFALGGLTFQQIAIDTADGDEILPGICTFFETDFMKTVGGGNVNLPPFFYGCYFEQFFGGGGDFWGGVLGGPPGSVLAGNVLDGDVIIKKRFHIQPEVTTLAHVYMAEGLVNRDIGPGQFTVIRANYPAIPSRIWGPGQFGLFGTSTLSNTSGDSMATVMLVTGGLRLNGGAVGFPWVAGSHAWGASVALTPGNVDANGGLWDPSTGAGFFNQM